MPLSVANWDWMQSLRRGKWTAAAVAAAFDCASSRFQSMLCNSVWYSGAKVPIRSSFVFPEEEMHLSIHYHHNHTMLQSKVDRPGIPVLA